MRFLLDENLPRSAGRILRDAGHEVVAVVESPMRGEKDPELLRVCNSENWVFITLDVGIRLTGGALTTGAVLLRPPKEFDPSDIEQFAARFDRVRRSRPVVRKSDGAGPGSDQDATAGVEMARKVDRMVTVAAASEQGIRVTFADGRSGVIPFADLPEIGDASKVTSIELPNPYELVVMDSRGERHEIPWDFARHYGDPSYRVEAIAERGRQ